LYQQNDKRRDSGFTIFYTLFNGGAGMAPLLCGYFGETYGYKYGFIIAGFAMLMGLLVYIFTAQRFLGDIGKYPTYIKQQQVKTPKTPLTKVEKDRVIVIWVMLIFVTFFFFGFEQAATTFNYYTDSFINKSLFGIELKTTFFQSINPFLILIFGSSFAAMWVALAKKGKDLSSIKKMGFGMITLALGFIFMLGVVIQRGGDSTDTTIKASMWWIIAIYVFHTIGELFLSPIGLSLVTKLAPAKNASLFMGLWFACIGIANIAAGFVVEFVKKLGAMNVFSTIAIVIFIMGVAVLFLSNKLLTMMHGRD
jgi:POT family proton-dependent oligopeptide transporter